MARPCPKSSERRTGFCAAMGFAGVVFHSFMHNEHLKGQNQPDKGLEAPRPRLMPGSREASCQKQPPRSLETLTTVGTQGFSNGKFGSRKMTLHSFQ